MPWPALAQSFITIGVLVLLWSLHSRLADRPVFGGGPGHGRRTG